MFGQKVLGSLKKDLKIAQFLIGLLQIKANLKNKVIRFKNMAISRQAILYYC
jgi:hypothetical protein